jgi:hypothetical protein
MNNKIQSDIDFLFNQLNHKKQNQLLKIATKLKKQEVIIIDEEQKYDFVEKVAKIICNKSYKMFDSAYENPNKIERVVEEVANDIKWAIINLSFEDF